MDNGLIYDLLDTIIRKEKEGQTISPEQFTELLQMCSWEKANADFSYFERDQIITDSLRSLKTNASISLTSGVGDISVITDYWHATNAYHSVTEYNIVPIDIVTDIEFQARSFSDLEAPQELWPVMKIEGNDVTVNPDTISDITLLYLKEPNVPFYDYYVNANDQIIYMPPGTNHTLLAGEEYRDGTTSGTVNSISVELSFPEGERVQVLYLILQKLGVSLNEADALQYGIAREQKEETT